VPTDLSRLFVEHLLGQARVAGVRGTVTDSGRGVDWTAVLADAYSAHSREQAEGRVVLAAFRLAAGLPPPLATLTGGAEPTAALLSRTPPPALDPTPSSAPPIPPPPPPPPPGPWVDGPLPARASPLPVGGPSIESGRPRGWRRLQRREKLATVFGWTRNIGIVVILFAAWQVWGTSISQHQAQASLRGQFRAKVHSGAPGTGSEPRLLAADVKVAQPAAGSVVARLQIPSIGVDEYVVQGTAEGQLAMGPGHYAGTAMPGQAGNVAIAGHRTTYGAPFNDLNNLAPGDPLFLTSDSGMRLEYTVSEPPTVVAPSDVAVLNFFGDNRLTLTTCNPRFSSSQRLVVVALLREAVVTEGASSGEAGVRGVAHVSGGGTVGWNFLYLPPVLAIFGVMVLLGLANKRSVRYFGRWSRWLVLTPIWVGATYLLFELLTSLLPATL
jgi:LPXTG-site transpeptidase (sortase) family protein